MCGSCTDLALILTLLTWARYFNHFPSWTATGAVGFLAYLTTSIFCGVAWAKVQRLPRSYLVPSPGPAPLALVLAVTESLFCFDMVFDWRFALHGFFSNLAAEHHLYERRHPFQLAVVAALGFLSLFAVGASFRRFRGRPGAAMAISGLLMSLTLFMTEIISMHQTDEGLYHRVSGVMVIAFLWVLACALTLLGVYTDIRSVAAVE